MGLSRAKRQQLIGAIAVMGPSGSGKTLGSLLMAYGMMKEKYPDASDEEIWAKVGLVDTEHERALIYEGMEYHGIKIGQFWHWNLDAPYSVERYKQAMDDLKEQGVEVIVVDSTTHAWEGEGGILDYQQVAGGNFQAWNATNKEAWKPMVDLFTGQIHGVHVINTMRTKQEYAMVPDDNGKLQVKKLGMKPVQRDSFEYEFQVVFSVDMDNMAQPSKDNSSMFVGQRFQLNETVGIKLQQWLGTGVDVFAERREAAAKAEAERLALVEHLREFERNHPYLAETIKGLEQHKTINKPLEQFDMEWLRKTERMMILKVQEQQKLADTAKGDN